MKPHMAHIQNTLIRKKLVKDATDIQTPYQMYKRKAKQAAEDGYSDEQIIEEIQAESDRIKLDEPEGDELMKKGIHNLKVAHVAAINTVIDELKGEI